MANRPSLQPIGPRGESQGVGKGGAPATSPVVAWPASAAEEALDSRLQMLAAGIRAVSGGEGVAIALREAGEMLCRATSGSPAPPLGARIDARSGLTGACVRSAALLRCDDSECDERVDREVCRELGIRSVVCVPVRRGHEVLGVFEIFSSQAKAFASIDIPVLHAIADEIAALAPGAEEAASTTPGEFRTEQQPQRHEPVQFSPPVQWEPAPMPVSPALARLREQVHVSSRNKKRNAVLGVLVLAFGTFLIARAVSSRNREAPTASATTGMVSADVQANPETAQAPTAVGRRPEHRTRNNVRRTEHQAGAAQGLAKIVVPAGEPKREQAATAGERNGEQATAAPPPSMVVAQEQGKPELSALVASLPQPAVELAPTRVSSGPSQPVLIHRVAPIYPAIARQDRIEGTVVLEAVIDKAGEVKSVRVVSGNSLLTAAAMRAVKQWRYQPYKLNGSVMELAIRINLNFELNK